MSFIQKKASHGLGEHSDSQAVDGDSSQETWGKTKFYKALDVVTWKQGIIG